MTKLEKEILEYIVTNDSEVTFYNVVRKFGFDYSLDIPSIIENFKNCGWVIEKNMNENAAFPHLKVTEKGKNVLNLEDSM